MSNSLLLDILNVICPVLGLGVNSFVQTAGIRYIAWCSYLKSIIFGFVCGFCFVVSFGIVFIVSGCEPFGDSIAFLLVNLISYSLLGLCYFAFINAPVSALRVRLLSELYESKGGLTLEEILTQYNSQEIIRIRIDRLVNNGQIICRKGRYYKKRSITLVMVGIGELLRVIIFGRKSGKNVTNCDASDKTG